MLADEWKQAQAELAVAGDCSGKQQHCPAPAMLEAGMMFSGAASLRGKALAALHGDSGAWRTARRAGQRCCPPEHQGRV